jgi:tRNA threonylcarbamoyladenosine biosynthesis protein TsaE
MDTININLESLEITNLFGIFLGRIVEPGNVICLDGDLGSGKTTLTQAIAKGLDVPPDYYVTSPSFNIFHEYPGRIPLYHMDFYRLHSSNDVIDIGLDEYFYQDGLSIIEWSEKALDILPEDRLSMRLKTVAENARQLVCSFTQQSWQHKLESIIRKISNNI